MRAFAAAAYALISKVTGETGVHVVETLPRDVAVRLFMESAFPMFKLDLTPLALGMTDRVNVGGRGEPRETGSARLS